MVEKGMWNRQYLLKSTTVIIFVEPCKKTREFILAFIVGLFFVILFLVLRQTSFILY